MTGQVLVPRQHPSSPKSIEKEKSAGQEIGDGSKKESGSERMEERAIQYFHLQRRKTTAESAVSELRK